MGSSAARKLGAVEAVYVHHHPSSASFANIMLEPRVRQELLDGLRAGREPDGSIVIDGPPRVALGLKPNPDGYPDPDNKVSGTGLRE